MKRKLKKTLFAKWEIISTAEIVETEYADKAIDEAFFDRVYLGDFVRAYRDDRTSAHQKWKISIVTKAQADDGAIHTHELEWQFDKPMTIREVLGGAKHIKLESNGIKTRWVGVSKQWLDCVDNDLKGFTALEAWATASCVAMVKPENQLNAFNKLFGKNLNY